MSCIMSVDSIFSENDYHTGCWNVSYCQQQCFSGLQQLYVHPAGDHAPPTYQMTPGLWCYNNCLLMVTCPAITFALLILRNWGPCFWLGLVGSSLLSELLNWPWARTKLPLKLKSNRSFNKDLFNFCCCLALVLIGISVAKLATCNDGI